MFTIADYPVTCMALFVGPLSRAAEVSAVAYRLLRNGSSGGWGVWWGGFGGRGRGVVLGGMEERYGAGSSGRLWFIICCWVKHN